MVKKRSKTSMSAAERRIRELAPEASTVREAVKHVIAELLQGVVSPPTDLDEVGRRIGVQEICYESFGCGSSS